MQNIEAQRKQLKNRLNECPLGEPSRNCAFESIRTMPAKQKASIVEKIKDSRLEEILDFHITCLSEQMGEN